MLRMISFGFDYHWAQIGRLSTVNWEVCSLLLFMRAACLVAGRN